MGTGWEHPQLQPCRVDCGNDPASSPGDPNSTYARVTRYGDDLYFFIHVVDFQSYAVTPQECVAHRLADSVEILIDPRGNGSQQLLDTGAAFKIPMADLPVAVDPDHMGLNITPYDEDNTAAAGTTTLRHIDQSTRLAWSTFGSVQSDPYRWGHATLQGYTPPADRPTTTAPPNVSHPNLDGVLSPQTIYQSAVDGVPISGRDAAPANDRITAVGKDKLNAPKVELTIEATGPGTAHVFLWAGDHAAIPVVLTSCSLAADPPPDYGFTAYALTDGGIPPWAPDMSGRIVGEATVAVVAGKQKVKIPVNDQGYAKPVADGSALVSFETPNDEVQALYVPLFEK